MTIDATRAARTALARVGEHRIDVVDNDSGDGSDDALCLAAATECWDAVRSCKRATTADSASATTT